MSELAIRARDLTVQADGRTILGPLDLQVVRGESVLLVGPSGCGKTTLLRTLAGLTRPTQGTLELFGRPVSEGPRLLVPPERRGVGMLFQGAALWPHMNARRTLRFALKHARGAGGERATDERVAELLRQVHLEGFEERFPATLSGGEKQRLALARALASAPALLLLDEPLGPLDAELRAALLSDLSALHAELGWTTIHVTHDPGEARTDATRLLRLEAGRLASAGEGAREMGETTT